MTGDDTQGRIASPPFRLADASLRDPRNPDVLHNLSVLFSYARDAERSALAARLTDKASK